MALATALEEIEENRICQCDHRQNKHKNGYGPCTSPTCPCKVFRPVPDYDADEP